MSKTPVKLARAQGVLIRQSSWLLFSHPKTEAPQALLAQLLRVELFGPSNGGDWACIFQLIPGQLWTPHPLNPETGIALRWGKNKTACYTRISVVTDVQGQILDRPSTLRRLPGYWKGVDG